MTAPIIIRFMAPTLAPSIVLIPGPPFRPDESADNCADNGQQDAPGCQGELGFAGNRQSHHQQDAGKHDADYDSDYDMNYEFQGYSFS